MLLRLVFGEKNEIFGGVFKLSEGKVTYGDTAHGGGNLLLGEFLRQKKEIPGRGSFFGVPSPKFSLISLCYLFLSFPLI